MGPCLFLLREPKAMVAGSGFNEGNNVCKRDFKNKNLSQCLSTHPYHLQFLLGGYWITDSKITYSLNLRGDWEHNH